MIPLSKKTPCCSAALTEVVRRSLGHAAVSSTRKRDWPFYGRKPQSPPAAQARGQGPLLREGRI